ncbi:unnamed protein product, partial [Dibothriocephalus latus]
MQGAGAVGRTRQKTSKKKAKRNPDPNRLYVGSLPISVNNRDLHEYFSVFGIVKEAFVLKGHQDNSRGFIVFQDV